MKKRLLQELDDLLQSVEFTHNAFQHVFQHAGSGMTLTDENGTILEVNPAFSAVTGYTHNEAIGKNPNILRSFYHDNKFYDDLWEKIKTIGYFESKIWNRRKTGEAYPEILTIQRIINPKTNTTYYLAVFSELHTLGSNIEAIDLSYYDALTQIANRTLLQEHLKDTTCNIQRATAKKENSHFGTYKLILFFLDINKFKMVNDIYGHFIGDKVLIEFVTRLKKLLRQTDLIARCGGDEFVIASLVSEPKKDASTLCARIHKTLEKTCHINGKKIHIDTSIGISEFGKDSSNIEELLNDADKAMYFSKKHNKPCMFYSDLSETEKRYNPYGK